VEGGGGVWAGGAATRKPSAGVEDESAWWRPTGCKEEEWRKKFSGPEIHMLINLPKAI
jgi:hypothetical protein